MTHPARRKPEVAQLKAGPKARCADDAKVRRSACERILGFRFPCDSCRAVHFSALSECAVRRIADCDSIRVMQSRRKDKYV